MNVPDLRALRAYGSVGPSDRLAVARLYPCMSLPDSSPALRQVSLVLALALGASGCPGPAAAPDAPSSPLDAPSALDSGRLDGGPADAAADPDGGPGMDVGAGADGGALDGGVVVDASSSGTIGTAGGTVTAGGASATIPAGALASNVAIGVAAVASPLALPAEYEAVSPFWAFTPHGTAFSVQASITIAHTGAADEVLRLSDPADTAWDPVTGASITATDATFTTATFSFYVVVRRIGAPVVGPFYPSAPGWNDYVVSDGADPFSATGATCTTAIATANVLHRLCVHSGEMRAVAVPAHASCAGLTATDALGAFDWRCIVSGGAAVMVSSRLQEDVRLAELLDFDALAWRENSVTVSDGATTVLTTPAERWWANPIVRDDDGGMLAAAGTIYVVRTDATADYALAADRIALVVEPGHHLGPPSPTSSGQVTSSSSRFGVWVEGDALGSTTANPWALRLVQSVVRHVRFSGAARDGLRLPSTYASRIEHFRCTCGGVGTNAIALGLDSPGGGNVVRDVRVAACGYAISLSTSRNVVEGVIVSSSYTGIASSGSSARGANILADVTSVHNDRYGVELDAGAVLMHATLANNLQSGLGVFSGAIEVAVVGVAAFENRFAGVEVVPWTDARRRFWDVASYANTLQGFNFFGPRPSGGFGYEFHGRFGTGQNGNNPPTMWWGMESCYRPFTWAGYERPGDCFGSRATVATPGPDGLRSTDVAPYSCVIDTNSTAGVDFLGGSGGFFPTRVPPIDEPVNTSDTNGTARFADITDWFEFEGPYRSWGAEGSATPNCLAQGACSPTSMGFSGCQIYDYALREPADEFLLGATLPPPTGDDVITVDFPIAGSRDLPDDAACRASFSEVVIVPPAGVRTYPVCRVTFLRMAREILGDLSGNDNLLCESGETCLFTPNIASYQGHGPIVPVASPFIDGVITGVTLLRHETNGVTSPWRP